MKIEQIIDPASSVENVTVGHVSRDYLTEREVDRLIEAAKRNRCGHRDATAILIAYRHGLRASDLVAFIQIRHRKPRLHCRTRQGPQQSAPSPTLTSAGDAEPT